MSTDSEPWHLDRKVPIALIVGMVAQTAVLVWGGATLFAQVQTHERQIGALITTDTAQQADARRISESLARLDERLAAQSEILRSINAALTRTYQPPQGAPR